MPDSQTIEAQISADAPAPINPLRSFIELLRLRNFRLLWIGEGVSVMGDQFYSIALPWLVLQLTDDLFVLGLVMALKGIPRLIFMLLAGALIDRFTPRDLMLLSNTIRMILVAMLTALVLSETLALWMLYPFALLMGIANAFFYPAQSAIVPKIVESKHRQVANSLVQGTVQASTFAGPLLAGLTIAMLMNGSDALLNNPQGLTEMVPDIKGTGYAFGVDAITFLISVVTLLLMKPQVRPEGNGENNGKKNGVWKSIQEALAFVYHDPTLRVLFFFVASVNFLVVGPMMIGIPVLAKTRLAGGAADYGYIISAFGGGSLLGIVLAGLLPKPPAKHMGTLVLLLTILLGVGMGGLGFVTDTVTIVLASLLLGAALGYVSITIITWLQNRTPESLMGRMMSLVMLASIGMVPASQALCGLVIGYSLEGMFLGVGIAMTLITLRVLMIPSIRQLGLQTRMFSANGE